MSKVVAVIGASSNRQKFGNKAVRAFVREGYTVVPIHPTETIPEVWLNPGADSDELIARASSLSITPIVACSIVAVGQNPYAL